MTFSCHPTAKCVSPEQVIACEGKSDADWCGTARIDRGHCAFGACIEGDCGDGVLDEGEACDEGPANSNDEPDACRTDCMAPTCGDAVVDTGEVCDDGNTQDGDGCAASCRSVEVCGNGVTDPGEACDAGPYNSLDPDAPCRPDCRPPTCGDGIPDSGAGEECDDGSANSDTATDACRTDCRLPSCGDAVMDSGEVCDDGNRDSGDGCRDNCEQFEYGWNCATSAPHHCAPCPPYFHGAGCNHCAVLVNQYSSSQTLDGSSWASAYHLIQDGVDRAAAQVASQSTPSCDVWITQGTYYIHEGEPADTVLLTSQVGLYGGFIGVELERQERDPERNVTTLDGRNAGLTSSVHHVVTAHGTVDATLDGLVITGGNAQADDYDRGGGLHLSRSHVHLEGCLVTQNRASYCGGGIAQMALLGASTPLPHSARLTLVNTRVVSNSAGTCGGGISTEIGSATGPPTAFLEATDSLLSDNIAPQGGALATATYAGRTDVRLDNCLVVSNSGTASAGIQQVVWDANSAEMHIHGSVISENLGAGVVNFSAWNVSSGNARLSITDSTISDNTGIGVVNETDRSGASVHLKRCTLARNPQGLVNRARNQGDASARVDDSSFQDHTTTTEKGGGVFNVASTDGRAAMHLSSCEFERNRAASAGAANNHADGGEALLSINRSTFTDNGAPDATAGTLANHAEDGAATLLVNGSVIQGSQASFSGAALNLAHAGTARMVLANSTILENRAEVLGGGLYNASAAAGGEARARVVGCTFTRNEADVGGAMHNLALASGSIAEIQIESSILWGDTGITSDNEIREEPGAGTASLVIGHSDIQGGAATGSNLAADPRFISGVAPFDLHLQTGSPCIDTGDDTAAPITDLEGNRRVDIAGGVGTPGTVMDMGAYEYSGIPSTPTTAYGHSFYWFSGTMAHTQTDAADFCAQLGGTLVALDTVDYEASENSLVQSLLSGVAWLSAYHSAGTTWLWPGDATIAWSNWAAGAPPNSTGGTCSTMDPASGLWWNTPCASVLPFLCEQPAY